MNEDKYGELRNLLAEDNLFDLREIYNDVRNDRLSVLSNELLEERDRFFRTLEQYAEDFLSGGMARTILDWAAEGC